MRRPQERFHVASARGPLGNLSDFTARITRSLSICAHAHISSHDTSGLRRRSSECAAAVGKTDGKENGRGWGHGERARAEAEDWEVLGTSVCVGGGGGGTT